LISRQRTAEDERVTRLALTDAGRALKGRAGAWVALEMDRSEVSAEEVEALRTQLWQLLKKLTPVPGP
jgi:DNA-binding MarR family transcriptional regulator